MDDSFDMRRVECISNLCAEIQHWIHLHRLSTDQVFQRLSLHHLHDYERMPVVLTDFMDGADVGMV